MKIEEIEEVLKQELEKRDLRLVYSPETGSSRLRSDQLIVLGAEQSLSSKNKGLIAGVGLTGFDEDDGNSPASVIEDYHSRFIEALEVVGIPRSSLHSAYPDVGMGKIWPTFIARLTQEEFRNLKPVKTATEANRNKPKG